jgi:hypothetical protein
MHAKRPNLRECFFSEKILEGITMAFAKQSECLNTDFVRDSQFAPKDLSIGIRRFQRKMRMAESMSESMEAAKNRRIHTFLVKQELREIESHIAR